MIKLDLAYISLNNAWSCSWSPPYANKPDHWHYYEERQPRDAWISYFKTRLESRLPIDMQILDRYGPESVQPQQGAAQRVGLPPPLLAHLSWDHWSFPQEVFSDPLRTATVASEAIRVSVAVAEWNRKEWCWSRQHTISFDVVVLWKGNHAKLAAAWLLSENLCSSSPHVSGSKQTGKPAYKLFAFRHIWFLVIDYFGLTVNIWYSNVKGYSPDSRRVYNSKAPASTLGPLVELS